MHRFRVHRDRDSCRVREVGCSGIYRSRYIPMTVLGDSARGLKRARRTPGSRPHFWKPKRLTSSGEGGARPFELGQGHALQSRSDVFGKVRRLAPEAEFSTGRRRTERNLSAPGEGVVRPRMFCGDSGWGAVTCRRRRGARCAARVQRGRRPLCHR